MYRDYIWFDNDIFEYSERKFEEFHIAAKPDRSLGGTLRVDRFGSSKKKFTFTFEVNTRQLARLYSIWSLKSSIVLRDWDEGVTSCTVICISNSFSPTFVGGDYFTISLDFEEV